MADYNNTDANSYGYDPDTNWADALIRGEITRP